MSDIALVPTRCVGTARDALRPFMAQRADAHSHAARGNEKKMEIPMLWTYRPVGGFYPLLWVGLQSDKNSQLGKMSD